MVSVVARLAAAVLIVIAAIFGLAFAWFQIASPFTPPETGYLRSDLERSWRMSPGDASRVLELDVQVGTRILEAAHDVPATLVRAGVTADGGTSPTVRIYPRDGRPAPELGPNPERTAVSWPIRCERTVRDDCVRRYLLVVAVTDLDREAEVRLAVTAEIHFPPHVPTPFLVGIGLDADDVRPPDELALRTAEVSGSAELSPDAGVVRYPIEVALPDGLVTADDGTALGGLALELSPRRVDPMTPAGRSAPAPLGAAVLDASGVVVGSLDVHPGSPVAISVPPVSGSYWLVLWWQDVVHDAYVIDWSLEQAGFGTTAPAITAGSAEEPPSISRRIGEGVAEFRAREPIEFPFGIGVELGPPRPDRLRPAAGVLRLTVSVDAPEEDRLDLVLALEASDLGSDGGPVVPLPIGTHVRVAVDALRSCGGFCSSWRGTVHVADARHLGAGPDATVRWSGEWELWPLDPSSDVQSLVEPES